jgi:glutathione S-transferase
VLGALTEALADQPYLLGEAISAADILWGTALQWGLAFGLVPDDEILAAYVERVTGRPAARKVAAMDAALAAEHEKAIA